MPSLKEITFANMCRSYISEALLLLDAPSLQLISVQLPHTPWPELADAFASDNVGRFLGLHSFPAISSANIRYNALQYLEESALFLFLDAVAPNIKILDITVYPDQYGYQVSSGDPLCDGEKRLFECCNSLYPVLGRKIFSQLSHLHIRAFLTEEPLSTQEALEATKEMCALRTVAGGLALGVESFNVLYFEGMWLVEIFVSVD
jgi:hypothetical protein